MKTNFDINLPSIPGKMIKFKIQDIKNKGFNAQSIRFKDNKVQLTKKFVQSFANFHEQAVPELQDDRQTQAESEVYRQNNKRPSRIFVPDDKKGLNSLKQEIQIQKLQTQQPKPVGFTFNKADQYVNQREEERDSDYDLTDNYYFTKQHLEREEKTKKPKKSAIFKNQPRKNVYARLEKNEVPPVGTYEPYSQIKHPKKVQKKRENSVVKDEPNYKHFKEIITKVMGNEEVVEQKIEKQVKLQKHEHMFMMDDRDRFGDQIYPIAPKLKTPGPGAYNINAVQSIQSKVKKVQVVEEQRKLLKEWFNN